MTTAYLDSSFFLAITLGERNAKQLQAVVRRFSSLVASDLLVAEVLSTAKREKIPFDLVSPALEPVTIVLPDRSLEQEMRRALQRGYLRGADLEHVACALFVAGEDTKSMAFLSRDSTQRRVARALGFATP